MLMKLHIFNPMKMAFLFLILIPGLALAQEKESPFPGEKTLVFDGKDLLRNYSFEVSRKNRKVIQRLWGEIQGGEVYVKFVDSKGIKRGGFSLVSGKTRARGTAEEVRDDFPYGTWTVEIDSKGATGKLRIQIKLD